DRRADDPDGARARLLQLPDQASLANVGVLQRLADTEHRRVRDVGLVERAQPLGLAPGQHDLRDQGLDLGVAFAAGGHAPEARVGGHPRSPFTLIAPLRAWTTVSTDALWARLPS